MNAAPQPMATGSPLQDETAIRCTDDCAGRRHDDNTETTGVTQT